MTLSGMLIAGDDIPVAYDRFRHRVMFPIGDAKGRIVAFGGRALDPEQNAKYLNSPETPLFHKGHLLFNAHRVPVGRDQVQHDGFGMAASHCSARSGRLRRRAWNTAASHSTASRTSVEAQSE